MNEKPGIFAVRSEQTLLALLYAIFDRRPKVNVNELVEIYQSFQSETGVVIYDSPLRPHC